MPEDKDFRQDSTREHLLVFGDGLTARYLKKVEDSENKVKITFIPGPRMLRKYKSLREMSSGKVTEVYDKWLLEPMSDDPDAPASLLYSTYDRKKPDWVQKLNCPNCGKDTSAFFRQVERLQNQLLEKDIEIAILEDRLSRYKKSQIDGIREAKDMVDAAIGDFVSIEALRKVEGGES